MCTIGEKISGLEIVEDFEDLKQYYQKEQYKVVAPLAFLIGTRKDFLYHTYNSSKDVLDNLYKNNDAVIIRALCSIRTKMMLNYQITENDLVSNLKNLPYQDLYKEDIKTLQKLGADITHVNYKVNMYLADINREITNRISKVKNLFPDWIKWEYIKPLFIMPKCTTKELIKVEAHKFLNNRNKYPFTMYINWNYPEEQGNILYNDEKFLKVLYKMYGKVFCDKSKVRDASDHTKKAIYDFIDENSSVALVVDCENSDAFKLAAMLKQLDEDSLSNISKIMLYDDFHTTQAWRYIETYTHIPVQYYEIERIKENKSLVDIKMAMGISEAYYKDQVTGFILLSSDSDFWAVISSLPQANFLVGIEYEKCGYDIKEALENNGTYYCAIDDFYTGNINDFKNAILKKELEHRVCELVDIDTKALLNSLYSDIYLSATEAEKNNFYIKYIKTLSLKIDKEGHFMIKIAD